MIFDRHNFYRLPNMDWCCVVYGVRKIYGNVHGVNRGLVVEDSQSKSFFACARVVLQKHERRRNRYLNWIKKANQIGTYERSWKGYRIYCTKEPKITSKIVERIDGLYKQTDFEKGDFVAVNREGFVIIKHFMVDIAEEIDIRELKEKLNKRGW